MNFAEMKSEIFETTDRVRDGDGFFSKEALEKYDKLFDNVSKNESQEISVVREGVSYGDRMKKYAEMFGLDQCKVGERVDAVRTDVLSKISVNDSLKNCPIENGQWEGERGNSKWKPDDDYVPQKQNPEGKTWGDILKDQGLDGINFKDGEPDFSSISKGDVEIEDFSSSRDDNFDKADIELAKKRGCSPEEVAKWRKENGYTWHECRDMKTMQKVPSIVHNNVSHRGGISEAKK